VNSGIPIHTKSRNLFLIFYKVFLVDNVCTEKSKSSKKTVSEQTIWNFSKKNFNILRKSCSRSLNNPHRGEQNEGDRLCRTVQVDQPLGRFVGNGRSHWLTVAHAERGIYWQTLCFKKSLISWKQPTHNPGKLGTNIWSPVHYRSSIPAHVSKRTRSHSANHLLVSS
jgi:hypothetical protein